VQFTGTRPQADAVQNAFTKYAADATPVIQPLGEDSFSIRSRTIDDATKGKIVSEFQSISGSPVNVLAFSSVSASVGAEVTKAAAFAIFLAAVAILAYIWFAFRGVDHAIRYGTAAILAMLHDILVVVGVEAILAYFLGWEADALFLTALLTVIGFSVHDTIVVFDRIRENLHLNRGEALNPVINYSIMQTLARSVITSLTVVLTLLALYLFGGYSMRTFALALVVGIISGTYSSIFNASQIISLWQEIEDRIRHRGGRGPAGARAAA
jgi:preprotein translocase subunit SecF